MKFAKSYLVLTVLMLVSPAHEVLGAATWFNDFTKAQAQARAEGKFVLVNFTGSDWCGWCIKLRKDVFLKPEFETYAKSNLVLLEIDFPKRKLLPPPVQQHTQKLAEQFQVQGYPTLIVLDGQGKKLGRISYGTGGPKPFISVTSVAPSWRRSASLKRTKMSGVASSVAFCSGAGDCSNRAAVSNTSTIWIAPDCG